MKPFDFTAVPVPLPSHKFRKRQTNFCYCSTNIRFMQVKKHAKENHLENPRYMWTVGKSGQRRTGTTAFPEGCLEISGNVPLTAPPLSELIKNHHPRNGRGKSKPHPANRNLLPLCRPPGYSGIPQNPHLPWTHPSVCGTSVLRDIKHIITTGRAGGLHRPS